MIKFFTLLLLIFYSYNAFSINVEKTIESTIQKNQKIKIGLEKLIESRELIEKATGAKLPTITSTTIYLLFCLFLPYQKFIVN